MDVDLSVPLLMDGTMETDLFAEEVRSDRSLEDWLAVCEQEISAQAKEWKMAGCRILQTPTARANAPRLAGLGWEDRVEEINRKLAQLTKKAAKELLVAGKISSTGLSLEPFGDTSFTEMISIFREQAAALDEGGVDLFMVEKLESISEARAAAIALKKFHKPVLMMVNVDENGETIHGGSAVNALAILQELGIAAFGINGTFEKGKLKELVAQMQLYAKVPLIVKPNACFVQDEMVFPLSPEEMAGELEAALQAGATLFGGGKGTTLEHLKAISARIEQYQMQSRRMAGEESVGDLLLADTKQVYKLYCDQIEFSEPLECTVDMTDVLLHLEEERIDIIMVVVDTADDAMDFAMNAHMANLPVCFFSHDEVALGLALLLYNGIAMIDSNSDIEEEKLKKIAHKYGAVIY